MDIISGAVQRSRATLCMMLLIVIAGIVCRAAMTIEASPNPSIPMVFINLYLDGASPEDGARLLVRPMEKELRAIEGLKEVRATSRESLSYIVVEFQPDVDIDVAVQDVRAAVDRAKAELPSEAEEPVVQELSADGSPTIVVSVSGDVPERTLFQTARNLKRQFETIPIVLEAEMRGHREEVVQAIIEPAKLAFYGLTSTEIYNAIARNNVLIPAGKLDTGTGRFAVKVPSLIETREDILNLPIRSTEAGAITLKDIASVERTFKDAEQYSSVNGVKAITIDIKKRTGANDIEVTQAVRALAKKLNSQIPAGVKVDFLMDMSDFSVDMVNEMQGNILTAMALVMVIVVAALGFRSGILVGLGVPFSLLFAAIILKLIGYSFNFMVLFGMLLALGMLIDGAIVITEFADRKMAEGLTSRDAYVISVKRMMWPVIASTSTTLAAFLPIMFWPGVAGEFMRYLPVTVFSVLAGSLFYALLFAPVMGAMFGKNAMDEKSIRYLQALETEVPTRFDGITGAYARLLNTLVLHPLTIFCVAFYLLIGIFLAFGKFNAGVAFFTDSEQVVGAATVRAQGNLSVDEAKAIVSEVEKRVLKVEGVKSVYSVANPESTLQFGSRAPEKDQIGGMYIETFKPEKMGYSTREVYKKIREATANMSGIFVSAAAIEGGPPVGKPVQLQLTGLDSEQLIRVTRQLREKLEHSINGLMDITDTTPAPGIDWNIQVDRVLATQMGASVLDVGQAVQLVTNGLKVGEYRPDDADEEVDIRVRYPESARNLAMLDNLNVNTNNGPVPVGIFVKRVAKPKIDAVHRIDGKVYTKILADVKDGFLPDQMVKEISAWLEKNPVEQGVNIEFRGANEEQNKSFEFLSVAFLLALFLMFILLVTQFNSVYQSLLTLSSVILSTAGVFLGLTLTQSTFSVIMTGVGIVALAGIVVNNNIVLIDTFNFIRTNQMQYSVREAAVMSAVQRLRPVFLTTITTILGLMPLAMGVSVDLMNRTVVQGGVVGSFWTDLASAIVYGLFFSTILTLIVTPSMLVLPSEAKRIYQRYFKTPLKNVRNKNKERIGENNNA